MTAYTFERIGEPYLSKSGDNHDIMVSDAEIAPPIDLSESLLALLSRREAQQSYGEDYVAIKVLGSSATRTHLEVSARRSNMADEEAQHIAAGWVSQALDRTALYVFSFGGGSKTQNLGETMHKLRSTSITNEKLTN